MPKRIQYLIYNTRLKKYFQIDDAGWQYVSERKLASPFNLKSAAEYYIKWLKQEHECKLVTK